MSFADFCAAAGWIIFCDEIIRNSERAHKPIFGAISAIFDIVCIQSPRLLVMYHRLLQHGRDFAKLMTIIFTTSFYNVLGLNNWKLCILNLENSDIFLKMTVTIFWYFYCQFWPSFHFQQQPELSINTHQCSVWKLWRKNTCQEWDEEFIVNKVSGKR